MKLYIVTKFEDGCNCDICQSDGSISEVRAFSTREGAEQYINTHPAKRKYEFDIWERELDDANGN